ncbi:MAG: DsbA family oxidoreductase [bacterium]|nr:DsbA family oxidoreductase [bacterium]
MEHVRKKENEKMKITYWSDYACPYCYIAEARLEKAIKALGMEDKIEIEMKSFELDPTASKNVVSSTIERFARKYRMTEQMAAVQIEQISQLGRAEGIDFNYVSTQYTNTMDAHRLTKLAQSKENSILAAKVKKALYDAYFTKNMELSDRKTLLQIAIDAGMDLKEVEDLLDGEQYVEDVRRDERQAEQYGIHGVPFFIVGEKYSISGAQSEEGFIKTIKKVLEENSLSVTEQAASCGIDGCQIR